MRELSLVLMLVASSCTAIASAQVSDVSEVGSDRASSAAAQAVAWEPNAGQSNFATVPEQASYIARPIFDVLVVHEKPDGKVTHELPATDERGVNTALALVGQPGEVWTEVQLAVRPNFTTGWVLTEDVDLTWTTLRVVIHLDSQRLTLLDDGVEITHGTVAIGTPTMPTPTGVTYVAELLASREPDGLYGPFALGLALFSDTVTEYAGGNGQVGIHGTNNPHLLGQAVSHGCVRTHNDLIRELAGRVPLGTPVEILP